MKISFQNRFKKWPSFFDFTALASNFNPLKSAHTIQLKKVDATDRWTFVHRFLEESKIKNLYHRLHGIYRVSKLAFKSLQDEGVLAKDLHPLEEQSWFVKYLKEQSIDLSAEEIWTLLLNLEQRDKYLRYLDSHEDWQSFEIFIQNYLIHSLSSEQLLPVFLLAYSQPYERKSLLEKLFPCLICDQAHDLFAALKELRKNFVDWSECCCRCVDAMRNSQVKRIIYLLPFEVENYALKKLYPCEVLEVIQMESDEKKKEQLLRHVKEGYRSWWQQFSHEEIKETYESLMQLTS